MFAKLSAIYLLYVEDGITIHEHIHTKLSQEKISQIKSLRLTLHPFSTNVRILQQTTFENIVAKKEIAHV